jgi:hypothetical protein
MAAAGAARRWRSGVAGGASSSNFLVGEKKKKKHVIILLFRCSFSCKEEGMGFVGLVMVPKWAKRSRSGIYFIYFLIDLYSKQKMKLNISFINSQNHLNHLPILVRSSCFDVLLFLLV